MPLLLAVLAGNLSGCAQTGTLREHWPDGEPRAIELADTPFFPQEDYQCGPAALATVLAASGVAVEPAQLVGEVYVPDLRGSLQAELTAAARNRGRVVYQLATRLDALIAQLEAGHPVLVLQNLRLDSWPAWHYAVVVGALPEGDELLLRSGPEPRKRLPSRRFMASWDRADRWAVIVLAPGELPAQPDWDRYLRAAADLEAIGQTDAAIRSYKAMLAAVPGHGVARLGLANGLYVEGRLEAAADIYLGLAADPRLGAVALNNLANLRADQGCYDAANRAVERARKNGRLAPDLRGQLEDTAARVAAARKAGKADRSDCSMH